MGELTVGHVNTADWAVVTAFVVALIALTFFVIGYVASTHGRALKTPEGRHMVNFRGSLVVFMAMGVAHNLVEDYPGRDLVRVVVVSWFALAAIQGGVLMVRAQRRIRNASRAATTGREPSARS